MEKSKLDKVINLLEETVKTLKEPEKPVIDWSKQKWFKDRLGTIHWIDRCVGYGFNCLISGDILTDIEFCTVPTQEEINAYFKEEFERRGYKEGVKVRSLLNGNTCSLIGSNHILKLTNNYEAYRYRGYILFKDGQFAEIIPAKKKVPKTKAEAEQFLAHAWTFGKGHLYDFLDQYDFKK